MVHHMQLHQLPQNSHQNPYTNTNTNNSSQQEQVKQNLPARISQSFTCLFVCRVSDCEPLHQQLVEPTALAQGATRQGQGELKRSISKEQNVFKDFLLQYTHLKI